MAIAPGRRWRKLAVPVDMVDRAPRAAVDVALVLAVDSSGSISEQRLTMQIQGYVDALRHPSFVEAVGGGRRGQIGLTYVTWTDARRQEQVVPWRVIKDQLSANAFAQAIHDALRPLPGWTSISGAIDFCTGLLMSCGYIATRRVIDISGDGANNDGRPVTEARDAAVAAGVTINGLPIIEVEPNLEQYYRDNVIGGPDAFVVVAGESAAFGSAILRKLLVEVAGIRLPGAA
ncbi:MAG TPA: DUF1194 domain-containing protein [Acetobacteraceae bacterium]|jgi:hypothetical protein|nr:DUF1194 domain-containing protein [Acetobacteraceae bacterium]